MVVSVLFGAASLAAGGTVAAAEDLVARANALFDEGKKLLDAGEIASACASFAESQRLAPRGGTLLNLGLCHEREGKLLDAFRELAAALEVAKKEGRTDREPLATSHLAAVDAKLSWLVLVPPPNVKEEDVSFAVDGTHVENSGAVPVESGEHVVAASASGFRAREAKVAVGAAPERRTVRIEALEALAPAAPAAAVASVPSPGADQAAPHKRGSRALRTAALVTGITGAVACIATGVFAVERRSVVSGHCSDKVCDDDGLAAGSTGRTLAIASTAAFAVGAIGFGGWLFLPGGMLNRREPARPPQGTGIVVSGVF
jgi:hypothetical protein